MCGACEEPLGEEWVALDSFSDRPVVVCNTCAPIVADIDRRVARQELSPSAASKEFERRRWPRVCTTGE